MNRQPPLFCTLRYSLLTRQGVPIVQTWSYTCFFLFCFYFFFWCHRRSHTVLLFSSCKFIGKRRRDLLFELNCLESCVSSNTFAPVITTSTNDTVQVIKKKWKQRVKRVNKSALRSNVRFVRDVRAMNKDTGEKKRRRKRGGGTGWEERGRFVIACCMTWQCHGH